MIANTGPSYMPFNQMNVAGGIGTNSFIKNRLSSIEFHHQESASASDEVWTFPVTSVSIDYNNNIRTNKHNLIPFLLYNHIIFKYIDTFQQNNKLLANNIRKQVVYLSKDFDSIKADFICSKLSS